MKFVRPWFFTPKENVPLYGSSLFLNQVGKPLQNIGSYFIETMQQYFDQRIEISTIRKVMETAVSDCNMLSDTDKDKLSTAMLHDPETAKRYYVSKDSKTESKVINTQWDKLYQHYTQTSNNIDVSEATSDHLNDSLSVTEANCIQQTPTARASLELIRTSALSSPAKLATATSVSNSVPSLASSPYESAEESEADTQQSARQVAEEIAQKFLKPMHSPSPNKYPLKPGDWLCSFCNYTNFAYRNMCNRCGKDCNKRSQYEMNDEPKSKKAKTNQDITAVLKKSTSKTGETIYKVKSQKQGEIWVNAKHVPANLL